MSEYDLESLRALEKRLAEASGPNFDLERAIFETFVLLPAHLYRRAGAYYEVNRTGTALTPVWAPLHDKAPPYTASLDAAIALAERVLVAVQWVVEGPTTPCATLFCEHIDDETHFAATPALALCLAIVRALIAEQSK